MRLNLIPHFSLIRWPLFDPEWGVESDSTERWTHSPTSTLWFWRWTFTFYRERQTRCPNDVQSNWMNELNFKFLYSKGTELGSVARTSTWNTTWGLRLKEGCEAWWLDTTRSECIEHVDHFVTRFIICIDRESFCVTVDYFTMWTLQEANGIRRGTVYRGVGLPMPSSMPLVFTFNEGNQIPKRPTYVFKDFKTFCGWRIHTDKFYQFSYLSTTSFTKRIFHHDVSSFRIDSMYGKEIKIRISI